MKLFEQKIIVPRRMRWVEDASPDVQAIDGSRDISFIGTAVGESRIIFFAIFGLVIFALLLARVIQLQIVNGDEWRAVAERNRVRMQPIVAERGIIFDRNLVPLVANAPNFRLTIRAQDLPRDPKKKEEQIRALGEMVQVPVEKIEKVLESFQKYRYASVVIKEPITYDEAVNVYLKSSSFPSLTIERGAKRSYVAGIPGQQEPLPISMSHVLGYLSRISPEELEQRRGTDTYYPSDTIGKTGIEALFERALRGVPGERGGEIDARGAERRTISVVEPVPGSSIVLTIDLEIQKNLEKALLHGMKISGQSRGSAIAIDPRDGSILGLVSLPAYDSNMFADTISAKDYGALMTDPNQPMLNRAVAGQFPSGSVIKPFYAAAALQEGIVTPTTTIASSGGLQIGKWFFPDWKAGGHGATDVYKAIAESVNTYFYVIGAGYGDIKGLGPERMKKYLEYFGFGRSTDSGIGGEASGFLQSPAWKKEQKGEAWYPGDSYNMSIGEGEILVTPMQIAVGLAAIVNGGTLWKPRLIDYTIGNDGSEIVSSSVVEAKVPIDERWLEAVRLGMRQTVTAGSARSLQQIKGLSIAGKTGTAQWSNTKAPHAWFEAFAPFEAPEIVTVFLIEEGKEGSSVAVPAAREFYSWWSTYRKN
jgi:penicillin-binding protein 2